jgi:parvulin-like peptidyl-prolyl isomerase
MNPIITDVRIQQVNDQEITAFLKETLQYKGIHQAVFSQRIIDRTAQERGILVSDAEIQEEADRQRRKLRLERAEDTLAWLQDQNIDSDDWELGIRARLLKQKLKEALFQADIDRTFNQNRLDFDKVRLYQIVVPYAPLSQELFYQIEEEELSFYEVAHAYDVDQMRRYRCGYEGLVSRRSLIPVLAAAVFSLPQGKLAGPVKTEQGYHLLLPEEFIPAQLTDEIRQELFDQLFKEWMSSELIYWSCQDV